MCKLVEKRKCLKGCTRLSICSQVFGRVTPIRPAKKDMEAKLISGMFALDNAAFVVSTIDC
jgi:hypothetical protein